MNEKEPLINPDDLGGPISDVDLDPTINNIQKHIDDNINTSDFIKGMYKKNRNLKFKICILFIIFVTIILCITIYSISLSKELYNQKQAVKKNTIYYEQIVKQLKINNEQIVKQLKINNEQIVKQLKINNKKLKNHNKYLIEQRNEIVTLSNLNQESIDEKINIIKQNLNKQNNKINKIKNIKDIRENKKHLYVKYLIQKKRLGVHNVLYYNMVYDVYSNHEDIIINIFEIHQYEYYRDNPNKRIGRYKDFITDFDRDYEHAITEYKKYIGKIDEIENEVNRLKKEIEQLEKLKKLVMNDNPIEER